MPLQNDIAREVSAGRLGTSWTTSDLVGNARLAQQYAQTTLRTDPPNESVSLPGLGLRDGHNAKRLRPKYWRVGRRARALLFALASDVKWTSDSVVTAAETSAPAAADDPDLEPSVESDCPQAQNNGPLSVPPLCSAALNILVELVDRIHRKQGWGARLANYKWRHRSFSQTQAFLRSLLSRGSVFARLIAAGSHWNASDKQQAVAWAQEVFRWGGTRQRQPVTAAKISETIENAVKNAIANRNAPMNSGYTKIASFATDYLEQVGGVPQAINDSRVSASLTSHLDQILGAHKLQPSIFPHLGVVTAARGGTRPRPLKLKWPEAYGSWLGQFATTQVIVEIRDILNRKNVAIGDGLGSQWTVRMVEAVLFMDGY